MNLLAQASSVDSLPPSFAPCAAQFSVNTNEVEMPNRRFWCAIGYDFMFKLANNPEGQYLLNRGADHGSIRYIRSHFTFNNQDPVANGKAGANVCGQVMTILPDGSAEYDFSRVNRTFHEYVKRGMKPIVEFDFFPDGMCYGTEDEQNDEDFRIQSGMIKDWGLWRELLTRFMENLEHTFGRDELKTWYFEVWNEPDALRGEMQKQFFRLYDEFAHVVKSFDQSYRIGGPATFNLYALKEFLDHVTQGTNYVTGEIGTPIDFVSHHLYGLSGAWLAKGPEITPQVSRFSADILWWQRLMKRYPSLSHVEIHLNEWGVCSNGDTRFVAEFPQLEYRNSEFSALFLVKLVDCLKTIEREYQFPMSMLLYWGACWNAGIPTMFLGSRDLTTTGNVPKPIFTGWEMLCRLGDDFLKVDGPPAGGRHGVIAAKGRGGYQLLVYNFNETDDDLEREDTISIKLNSLKNGTAFTLAETRLDRTHHNTYREWQRLGCEANPGKPVVDRLMEIADLTPDAVSQVIATKNQLTLSVVIPRHAMVLLELTACAS